MIDISKIDYSILDRPEILMYLFHPRPEFGQPESASTYKDIMIPVDAETAVGARFHIADKSACNILFFHGNGEIVADYDDFGRMMNQMGINFLAVDYRGYGRSTGQPTVTSMMRDCHMAFDYVKKWLDKNDCAGPLCLMGRSLGSASVLELASHYAAGIDGLIVESGFAYAGPLLTLLGIAVSDIGFDETQGFRNIEKIRTFQKPTLIIHAERDHIIPFSDGEALFDACASTDKTFLKIPGANHNDIFMHGFQHYMAAVSKLTHQLVAAATA
jgi:fermentation-respiration switch protein FrsA (DUF1100 family)